MRLLLGIWWAPEATVTTRSVTYGSSRFVRAKCPRWFVPNCISKPSLVVASGMFITPALLISRSRSPCHDSANSRTEARSARSRRRTSTVPLAPWTVRAAASPRFRSRTASTTCAPARARASTVAIPSPLLAPVTTAVRPVWSTMSLAFHFCLVAMSSNVGVANNAVNANNAVDANNDGSDNKGGADNNVASGHMATTLTAMQTRQTRRYHHGDLRAALLTRAEETLREKGPAALSLRELARDLGVSHAAPSRHFKDKQALLDALALVGFERMGEALDASQATADETFADRLGALARSYVGFATANAELLDLMFSIKHDPTASEALVAGRTEHGRTGHASHRGGPAPGRGPRGPRRKRRRPALHHPPRLRQPRRERHALHRVDGHRTWRT